jgi:hypothetical protein
MKIMQSYRLFFIILYTILMSSLDLQYIIKIQDVGKYI